MFQTKAVGENHNTHFVFINFFFRKSCSLWDNVENMVQPDRLQMTIWRMRIACWMTKATNTHAEYVVHTAFPLQRWWHERVAVLRCTYIASLVLPMLFNHLNTKLNPICHLLALLGAHHILHVSRIRFNDCQILTSCNVLDRWMKCME